MLKEIVVLSGKGGTGKTSITASLATAFRDRVVLVDADVDAPNMLILLDPEAKEKRAFTGGKKAFVDREICDKCGVCTKYCRFSAIDDGEVDFIRCEGCGVCAFVCPKSAIEMREVRSGEIGWAETRWGPFVFARLDPGEGNSGKLVTEERNLARDLAKRYGKDLILVDGPPGMGCPVIASLTGVDLAIAVVEPTLSALHDLQRVYSQASHFGVKVALILNKIGLSDEVSSSIRFFANGHDIPILAEVPYDEAVPKAMIEGISFLEHGGEAANSLRASLKSIEKMI
ncbi:MAG: ATP-binding protein [Synergistetes bacterium]|nr:ATP-binding protein [Synergistota bacterium]